jgi:hypothetical protein
VAVQVAELVPHVRPVPVPAPQRAAEAQRRHVVVPVPQRRAAPVLRLPAQSIAVHR